MDNREEITYENSNCLVPALDQPLETLSREINLVSGSEQPPHIGDTNIHTTGPVYNAPVQITVHQTVSLQRTVEQPHSSTQSRPANEETVLHNHIKSLLREKVEEIACGESSLAEISKSPISPVNLAMVSNPVQIANEFEAEGYNSELFFKQPVGDISVDQLFNCAKERAQQDADRKFKSTQVRAKTAHVEKHANVVGIVGQAGIGKTTSAKKWALQALAGELFQNISFFFYIVIRFMDFEKELTLFEFLFSTMLSSFSFTQKQIKSVIKLILHDHQVLLLFDGLDEAAFDFFSSEVPIPSLHSRAKAEYFLKHLAGGNLLPHSRKIFTSRPVQLYQLHASYRPSFVVEILGLNPRSQDELGRQICGRSYREVQQKLTQKYNLFAYCYVPVNFVLTCNFLMSYTGDIQMISMSRVLAYTSSQYAVTNHLKRTERVLINKLAKLAWNGMKKKKIVFSADDLLDTEIDVSLAEAFLHTSVTKRGNLKLTILNGHKRKYFSHLIWQEFFAAIYLMMVMPLPEFRQHYKKLLEDRWDVVSWFAFGVCDNFVSEHVQPLISGWSQTDTKTKINLLKTLIELPRVVETGARGNDKVQTTCRWAHEANSPEITTLVHTSLPSQLGLSSRSFADLENLCFVLRDQREHKLDSFSITNVNLGIADIRHVSLGLHNFSLVTLIKCGIDEIGAAMLCEALENSQTPLDTLFLCENDIGNSGATSLSRCVKYVKELYVRNCGIGPRGIEELSQQILENPLKMLNIHGNNIEDAGAVSISRCVHNISTLDVSGCGIKDYGMSTLCGKIAESPKPMTRLVVSGNGLTSKSAQCLEACAHNIKILYVTKCSFTETEKCRIEAKVQNSACL